MRGGGLGLTPKSTRVAGPTVFFKEPPAATTENDSTRPIDPETSFDWTGWLTPTHC